MGKLYYIGIRKTETNYVSWSKQEDALLKRLYPTKTAEEMAKQIGRPVYATKLRVFLLELKKRKT